MKKILGFSTALVLCVALAASAAQAGKSKQNVVNINFATYVWQPTTVKAMNAIVDSWNKTHAGIQVHIVPVDVNSVHDKLLTSFVGGTAADVIHDEAADIAGFTEQGYLANLKPLIPKAPQGRDPAVGVGHGQLRPRQDHRRADHAPDLQRLRQHERAEGGGHQGADGRRSRGRGTQFRAAAKKLSTNGNYGVCWGLRSPTATIQTISLNWGGQWNYLEKGRWVLKVGAGEQTTLTTMHDMIYADKSIDPAGVGLSGSAVLPAFFGGKCAMTVQGNYQAQGMIQQSPKGFNWAMFPPLKGKTQDQTANPQTLSISAQSQHKAEAMQFIAYALNSQNMAKLSAGDWLIPAAPKAAKIVVKSTKHYGSWKNAVSAVPHFKKANWVTLKAYPRWKAEIATPAFRQYLSNQIDLDKLTSQLVDGWNSIRG